jgi:Domain of unknown function (DUF1844)
MNEPHVSEADPAREGSEEMRSALFAHMVMQQSSMAMMLLGQTPHPETGKVVRDLEAAKLFIDMLEMLESKTQGNLTHDEAALLKQSLMSLRMAFVEAVDTPSPQTASPLDHDARSVGSVPASEPAKPEAATAVASAEEEHPKKFTKKY